MLSFHRTSWSNFATSCRLTRRCATCVRIVVTPRFSEKRKNGFLRQQACRGSRKKLLAFPLFARWEACNPQGCAHVPCNACKPMFGARIVLTSPFRPWVAQFTASAVETQRKLDVLANACREIKESTRLRTVLETILMIGNVMNEGTHKGGAQGFTLDRLVVVQMPAFSIAQSSIPSTLTVRCAPCGLAFLWCPEGHAYHVVRVHDVSPSLQPADARYD
jgi:hypothetical protein